jgi:cytochrome P450
MFMAEPMFLFRFNQMLDDMFNYGERVMADRIKNPRQDLLTVIANATLDDKPLSQNYLDGSWLLIIFAGNDTTRNSLSGTIRLMTEFQQQRQMVIDDPSLIERMSHEALRMTSPVMHMRRTATEDTEIAGQRIAENEKVIMWLPTETHQYFQIPIRLISPEITLRNMSHLVTECIDAWATA